MDSNDSTSKYPKRDSHFAHKVTRLLFKSCACQDLGHHAVLLIVHIAHTEDAARYQNPVRFWNSQLMETLGFKSPKQLTEARRRACDAGWLNYEREHDRAVGKYWAIIPPTVLKFDDLPIEESSPIHSAGGTENGIDSNSFSASGTRYGMGSGMGSGKPSYPIPNPKYSSCPNSPSPDEASDETERRKPQPSPEDSATARWMWAKIQSMQPRRKAPDLQKWAGTIRLMRIRDGRTDTAIRETFEAANRDSFWRTNILSPDTLRARFDDLRLKLRLEGQPAKGQSIYQELRPPE